MRNAALVSCDVAIVGGGIAGIAIAERLAREARRQGKTLRILLVEQEDSLGTGASGGLEGWFHTGALYSRLNEHRHFINCLNSFEDLYNWYYYDRAFPFWGNCNLKELNADSGQPGYEFREDSSGQWFLNEVTYLLSSRVAKGNQGADGSEWRRISAQTQAFVAQAFFKCDWFNKEFHCCQSPFVGGDAEAKNGVQLPTPTWDCYGKEVTFLEWLEDSLTPRNPDSESFPHKRMATTRADLEAKYQRLASCLKGSELSEDCASVFPMISRDSAFNSWRVLRDLAEAANQGGVQIVRGYSVDRDALQVSPSRSGAQIRGVLIVPRKANGTGGAVQIVARQYILAMGLQLSDGELLHKRLGIGVQIDRKISVMAAARPAFLDTSFARMDLHARNDFNHIYRPCDHLGDKNRSYSIVADSVRLPSSAAPDECLTQQHNLLGKIVAYFGDAALKNRNIGFYWCDKTEFRVENDERNYSFWWGPEETRWEEMPWESGRNQNQRRTQDGILQHVARHILSPELRTSDFLTGSVEQTNASLDGSSWAMKKALHFLLQGQVWAANSTPRRRFPSAVLQEFQQHLARTCQQHAESSSRGRSNFLCIIPGKFSHFPTIAHQVYLEMEARGLYVGLPIGTRSVDRPPMPENLVAPPRAECLLDEWETSRSRFLEP